MTDDDVIKAVCAAVTLAYNAAAFTEVKTPDGLDADAREKFWQLIHAVDVQMKGQLRSHQSRDWMYWVLRDMCPLFRSGSRDTDPRTWESYSWAQTHAPTACHILGLTYKPL